ncbi:MAG: glycosyltransferase, partial [Proteobacteria bacterium]
MKLNLNHSNQVLEIEELSQLKILHVIQSSKSAASYLIPILERIKSAGPNAKIILGENSVNDQLLNSFLVDVMPMELTTNLLTNFRRAKNWADYFKNNRINVLHCHQTRSSIIPLTAAYIAGVKIRIYHNHGLPYLGQYIFLKPFLFFLEVVNICFSTHTLFVSRSNMNEALSGPLRFLLNGDNLIADGSICGISSNVIPHDSKNYPKPYLTFGYVGRPNRRKGFQSLMEIWEKGHFGSSGHRLLLAGIDEGDRRRLAPKNVNVSALGFIRNMDEFYGEIDVLLMPSEHEGLGMCILEAAQYNVPCIASDIPGIRCAIVDG